MFRNGGSEYAINGESCRLLDVQELLSDSGIGREMHVIVGQGQLDAVLRRHPRGAPRVHRGGGRRPQAPQAQGEGAAQARRDAGQPDPRRRPHRRAPSPAQAAGPAGRGGPPGRVVQADLRDARLRLLADDLRRAARPRCEQEVADETALRERTRRTSRPRWPPRSTREAELEAATAERAPAARPRPGDLVPALRRCASGCAGTAGWPSSGCASWPWSPRTTARAATPRSWRRRPRQVRARGGRARWPSVDA